MRHVKIWLFCCAMMCIAMVCIGGYTRLSNAGLSIVEWKPISGILPPISHQSWSAEFAKYQESPEYKLINNKITLQEFKAIFWIEFIHRIMGRLTGIIILLPLIYFYSTKTLVFNENKSYVLLPIIVLMQGVMGWYMVKSGLTKNPYVSHFRLALHLMLAVVLYTIILWKLYSPIITTHATLILAMIYTQIFLGGLVAGLDAGMVYNTFPMMGIGFIPSEFTSLSYIDIWYDPSSIQFMHRSFAYILTAACMLYAVKIYKSHKQSGILILCTVGLQALSGVATLLLHVPLALAMLHQLGAFLVITVVLYTIKKV